MECVACGIRQSSEKSNQQSKTTTQNMGLDKQCLSYKDDRTGWNVRKSVESEDGGCGHRDEIVGLKKIHLICSSVQDTTLGRI